METKGHYFYVGLFTVGVLTIALLFIMWLSLNQDSFSTKEYRIEFEGSVQGLSPSAPVYFNGLRIGNVSHLAFDQNNPKNVFAYVNLADYVPIRVDTRAQLNYQGVTGVADIQLTGGSNTAALLKGENGEPPTLRAEPSIFQDLLSSGREILTEGRIVLTRLSSILGENGALLNSSIRNVNNFTQSLADNTDKLENFMESVGNAASSIQLASDRLNTIVSRADALAEGVDVEDLKNTLSEVQAFAESVAATRSSVRRIVDNAVSISTKLDETTSRVNEVLKVANSFSEEDLNRLLNNSNLTLEEMRNLVVNLQNEINIASPRIQAIATNIENFTEQDLQSVSSLIESGDLTIEEYRNVARNMNEEVKQLAKSLKRVTGNLEALSSKTLQDVSLTLESARQAAESISRAARNLEKEPQSLLLGNPTKTPQYDGVQRR